MRIAVVTGNPKPASRTHAVALAVAAALSAVPVMTGGWPGHLLAVEVHLRPVLVELGATVPARGLYVTEPELPDLDAAVARWAENAVPLILRALPRLALSRLPRPGAGSGCRCRCRGPGAPAGGR